MAPTLPTFTRRIDDAFTETWYDIKAEAVDNILLANPLWAILKLKGCMTPQAGGDMITETIKYGTQTAVDVKKGDTLSQGEPVLETVARWTFRMMSTHVQRDLFTDRENRGKYKIKDYVMKRLNAARDALVALEETELTTAFSTTAETTDKGIQGLNELVPPYEASEGNVGACSATYGMIDRPATYAASGNVLKPATGNTWWGPVYKAMTTPVEVNLPDDMRALYNGISDNLEPPDLLVSDLASYEAYESYGLDMAQIVKDEGGQLVDLGFSVMRFKGKPWVWSSSIALSGPKKQILMLNTKYIKLVYDPGMWFDMTEWKSIPLQATRIAHILCACNLIGTQPRRQGRLYEA